MNLRSRIETLEGRLGLLADRVVSVVWIGPGDTGAHEHVAEVQRRGQRVRLITFSRLRYAKTTAEADEIIAAARAKGAIQPITVMGPPADGAEALTSLASWDGAPEWANAMPRVAAGVDA